jgi:hypothetical protein
MAEQQPELAVIRKTYDLVKWSCGHTSKFPRSHRFVLGERIERRLYDLLETLIQARYTPRPRVPKTPPGGLFGSPYRVQGLVNPPGWRE